MSRLRDWVFYVALSVGHLPGLRRNWWYFDNVITPAYDWALHGSPISRAPKGQ